VNTIQNRIQIVRPKQPLIGNQRIGSEPSLRGQGKGSNFLVANRNNARPSRQFGHHFSEIAGKSAPPTERVHVTFKRSFQQRVKTRYLPNPSFLGDSLKPASHG
jgi:hypothetical protein